MRKRKLVQRRKIVCALLVVVCLGVIYKRAGYLVYEQKGLMYHKCEIEEEKVQISLKYRPIAAFFGRIRGELWITYRDKEYHCEIENDNTFSYVDNGPYNPNVDCNEFLARYWYTDDESEIYLNYISMYVLVDRLLPMDKMAIVSANGYRIYSIPIDEAFKESVDHYRSSY